MSKYKLNIIQDQDCGSPRREFDNLGTIVAWGRDYEHLGDCNKHGRKECTYSRDTFWQELAHEHAYPAFALACKVTGVDPDDCWEDLPEDLCENIARQAVVVLPFYYDRGQIGWIFCRKGTEDLSDQQIENNLAGELEIYTQWLEGEVFGFQLYSLDEDGEEDEELDSVWGVYGDDPATNGIAEYLPCSLSDCTIEYTY